MTPTFITSDATLREYIPNVLTTVEGEQTLFQKMQPDICQAEMFLTSELTSIAAMGSDNVLLEMAKRIVCTKAFILAIPKLDLVLTPNGFGIVSNGNVAPASKERVDRLLNQLDIQLGQTIAAFFDYGYTNDTWRAADAGGQRHLLSIFRGLDAEVGMGEKGNLWTAHREHISQLMEVQQYVARTYISQEVLESIIADSYKKSLTGPLGSLTIQLRPIVLQMLKARIANTYFDERHAMRSIVDYIRTHKTDFPTWENSKAGRRYLDHNFHNSKTAAGFWL